MARVRAGNEFVLWIAVSVMLGVAAGWLLGHGWRGGALAGGLAGALLWFVRFLEGESLARMPWDREIDDLERRVKRLEGREP